jgi:hypothetical protein
MTIYSDPLLASKPYMLRNIIWNIGNSHHNLAFTPDTTEQDKQTRLQEAISWYQEYTSHEGITPDEAANAVNASRLCRLGQPPKTLPEMEGEKHEMGPG